MSLRREMIPNRRFLALLLIFFSVNGFFGWRVAHASSIDIATTELVKSLDAIVGEPPTEIAIDFAKPVQIRMVKVRVLDEKGEDHAVGAPIIRPDRKRISVHVDHLRIGYFVVEWGVIGIDGAHLQGRYSFRIGPDEVLSERTSTLTVVPYRARSSE